MKEQIIYLLDIFIHIDKNKLTDEQTCIFCFMF